MIDSFNVKTEREKLWLQQGLERGETIIPSPSHD